MAEENQIKWVGVRPVQPLENIQVHPGPFETSVAGKTRTQINKSVEINNTAVFIHTVTAGKVFYLTACTCSADSGVGKLTHLYVANAAEETQYIIIDIETAAAVSINDGISFPSPIAIPALWKIGLSTENAHGAAFITGWEE